MPLISKNFSDIITFTRASTGTYIDSAGLLQTAAIGAPRFDYNPTTLAAQGFLIEEARTNLVTYSEDLSNAAWNKGLMSVTGGNTDPFGTNTAYLVNTSIETSATFPGVTVTVANSTTYVLSAFVKVGTASHIRLRFGLAVGSVSAWYSIAGGTFSNVGAGIVGLSATTYPSGWVRIAVSIAYGASDGGSRAISLSPVNGSASTIPAGTVYLWGAQLEAGAFATSYIPTVGAAVTRAADVASINTLSPWFNNVAGTLYAEYSIPYTPGATQNIEIVALVGAVGVTQNGIAFYVNGPSGKQGSANVWVSGVSVGRIDATTNFVAGTYIKYASAYAANDRAVTSSGTAPTTSTTAYTPPTINSVSLGGAQLGYISGYLRRITYYPRRLSNAELQALTT